MAFAPNVAKKWYENLSIEELEKNMRIKKNIIVFVQKTNKLTISLKII